MRITMSGNQDEYDRVIDQMGAMIDEMLNKNFFRSSGSDAWQPAMNVYEAAECFLICVDIAGMERNKIDLYFHEDHLYISGVREKPALPMPPEDVSVHLMEIDSGRFQRCIPLPADANRIRVSAIYRNGYLWITLPRRAH